MYRYLNPQLFSLLDDALITVGDVGEVKTLQGGCQYFFELLLLVLYGLLTIPVHIFTGLHIMAILQDVMFILDHKLKFHHFLLLERIVVCHYS